MGHSVFMYLLCAFGVVTKGMETNKGAAKQLTALIQTQQTVMAAAGDEALLSCQLTEAKDVHQVTWKKSEGQKDLAAYSKRFGERVNPDFRDKVKFKDAGLQSSSIVIMDVTEKDEGCYKCLFNTYPDGALIGETCLKLCELHEPVLHVTESNSPQRVSSESNNSGFNSTFIIVPLTVTCCFAFVIIYVLRIRKSEQRMDKTTKDVHEETQTPLVTQENMQIRQRTPPEKNLISNTLKPSSSAARRLNFDSGQAPSDAE